MYKSLKIALTAFVVTAGLRAPTLAAPVAPAANVSRVHTADLDLKTIEGQRRLDARLVIAVREVCGTASDVDLAGRNEVRKCRADVLAKARTQRDQILAEAGRGKAIALTSGR